MASIGARTAAEKALGGLTRRSIRACEVLGRAVHADVASGAYMLYKGKSQPLGMEADSTAATGAAGVEHVALLPGVSQYLHYFPIVNAGNVLVPPASADGLDLTLSQTNDEGCQYVPGGLFGPWRMTVERTANQVVPKGLFIRLRAAILDVSGTDDFAGGFRKAEAYQAAIDNYDESAVLNVISGDVKRETILNNAATVVVDTISEEYLKERSLKLGEGVVGHVAEQKKSLAILDVLKEPRYKEKELARKEGLVSMLSVPLIVKDKVIGVINAYTSYPHEFTETERDILTVVANGCHLH